MKIQLIRHATLIISLNNKRILVDPMLSSKGTLTPIPDVPNQNFNPLVELPVHTDIITNCDAVLVTHIHRDHFDDDTAKLLPKNIPVLCQPEDKSKLQSYGFTNVYAINSTHIWNDITFHQTNGKHGHGEMAIKMAPVSGFVISYPGEPSVYIAGDTVWCQEVEESIEKYIPEIVVCNCGAAQFSFGEPITMTANDIHELVSKFPKTKVIAVHMEAWNHCRLSRQDLNYFVFTANISGSVLIPEDGEVLNFSTDKLIQDIQARI